MKVNVGTIDRAIRAVLGIVLLAWAFLGLGGPTRIIVAILGLIPLVTAVGGVCPLYSLLGISTCPVKHNKTA